MRASSRLLVHRTLWVLALVAGMAGLASPLRAQMVGDRVRLESTHPAGVPVHPAAGDPAYVRWTNGTVGIVGAVDAATGWRRVESNGDVGWVTTRYLVVLDLLPGDYDHFRAHLSDQLPVTVRVRVVPDADP